ncbi:MAG: sugar kinase [Proteobacteria bacterium]|nr:sugar kinase [Pseudomonadota bacterium]
MSSQKDALTTLAVGQVTHDRYGEDIVAGGCAFYAARTWQALGARVRLATAVGEDFDCDAELKGLDVVKSLGACTTVFTNTYPDDGPRCQWVESTAPPVRPDALPQDWQKADILFLAPVFGELDLVEWSQVVDARYQGLGLQGFLKQSGPSDPEAGGRRPVVARPFAIETRLLERMNAVFLSEEDIEVFGEPGLLDELRRSVPLVVMTRGDQGSRIFQKDNIIDVGISKAETIDPTGAGDTYAAAFLFALASGSSPTQAARLGAAAASIVVEGQGGGSLHNVGGATLRAPNVPIVDS